MGSRGEHLLKTNTTILNSNNKSLHMNFQKTVVFLSRLFSNFTLQGCILTFKLSNNASSHMEFKDSSRLLDCLAISNCKALYH